MTPTLKLDLGSYLREQRRAAKLSLRQLSELAGISNPYLSQIERGLKKPSAEILQQIARGLEVSAESLYVRAGILEETSPASGATSVLAAIAADPRLTDRQRQVLVDVYRSFVEIGPGDEPRTAPATGSAPDGDVATEPTVTPES
ncbi:MAG TPA: helix-turn-helix transcriptional regulator [Dermatophilaceae bacterium]|jgi:transcriptional regulator with XRE-family HTH domain|nr:MAG: Transcriptional regulator ClgR [bacterium ADurb.BinA028]HOA59190.1 helix-turn-helix transcriptional regulator [Dermatophilaceae bacterium]HPZ68942.1 helix-turn-helix transcriptional regulator [Dermatophilaceae bacterium]HQD02734.1 helix-turn-helix transcriptional regulator [Dermatophilaceae bacterium]